MRKFLLGATALVFAFTMSKCTFNGPAAYAGNFEGCTNVWVGGKLTKTGTCVLSFSKSKGTMGVVYSPDPRDSTKTIRTVDR